MAVKSALFSPDAAKLKERLGKANLKLATSPEVSGELKDLIGDLGSELEKMTASDMNSVDPYLVVALQQGVIGALRAMDHVDKEERRQHLRISLERTRQALRDILEGLPVQEDRPTKDVTRWLADVLDVPQTRVADLLSVSPRKFQRWISVSDPASPHDEDALRVRLLARIVNHLRHAFTGPGVVAWLERPHPDLKGNAPLDLLKKQQTFEQLAHLAASARSSAAS